MGISVKEIVTGRKTFFVAPDTSLIPESYLEDYFALGYECYFVENDKRIRIEKKVDVILSLFRDVIIFFNIDYNIPDFDWANYIKTVIDSYGNQASVGILYTKRQAKEEKLHLIDATEGGAKIHGSEVLTLSDAIDLYCKKSFSFEDILQGIEPTFSGKKYENVKKDIMHIGKEMKNVKEYTQKGIVKCERYLQKKDELTEQEKNTLLREIRKTHNFISKQEIAAVLLDSYTSDLVNEKISDLNMITNDVELDRANSVKTVLLLYQSFQKGLEDLTGLLEETLSLV